MNQSPLRNRVLRSIETRGSRLGAPTVNFPDKIISVPGEDFAVPEDKWRWILQLVTGISGFYLALPANVLGVVNFPNGTSQNMEGGVHEAPPGLYKVQYVDGHERTETLSPISEMTTDGENITLRVVLRYRVLDPLVVLRTNRPVETLLEHVETDVAQYIRTHAHTDIADSSEHHQDSRLLSFFIQRHNRRVPFCRAFSITGIEIKDFTGDNEFVEMRRKAGTESMRNQLERQQLEFQQQMTLTRAQFKAEGEKAMMDHNTALEKKSAEHKAEIEQLQARHEREKQAILNEVHLREIDLDNKRRQLQQKRQEFSQLMETLSHHFTSGNPTNPAVLKTLTDLLLAYKEDLDNESQPAPVSNENENAAKAEQRSTPGNGSRTSSDKVENLKNTLLNLLNPKK